MTMETDLPIIEASDALTQVSLEMWKLLRAFERALIDLPNDKASKRAAQYRYSKGRFDAVLEGAGLRLLTFEGQKFSANLPVSPVNADEIDDPNDALVELTIEPTIVGQNIVLHTGKVMLSGGAHVSRD
jgi:hypothetical protein